MRTKTVAFIVGSAAWVAGWLGLQGYIMKRWPITSCDDERKKKIENDKNKL